MSLLTVARHNLRVYDAKLMARAPGVLDREDRADYTIFGQRIRFWSTRGDFGAPRGFYQPRFFFFFFDVLSYSFSLYVDSNATLIYKLLDSILKCSTPPKSSKLWIFDEKPREGNYSVSNLFTMSSLKYLEHLSQDVFASSLRCMDFFAARVSSNCLWPFSVEVYMNMLTAAPLVKHEFWKLQLEANGHLKLELPKKFSFGITNVSILSQLLHRSTEQQRQGTRTLSPSFLSKEQTSVIVHDDTLVAPNHLGKS